MNSRKTAVSLAVIVIGVATLASAALLGVSPGYPQFFFNDVTNSLNYNSSTQKFSIVTVPGMQLMYFPTAASSTALTGGSVSINLTVDNSGNLVANTATPTDLVIQDSTGTLLQATIHVGGFGYSYTGTATNTFDFRFVVTGGSMASGALAVGTHIGVMVTSEGSTFNGFFNNGFAGHSKGTIGPIAGCGGSIGDYVWHDVNGNGIQDNLNQVGGEPGLGGLTVELMDASNNVLATTLSDTTPATLGHYTFSGLCPGDYKVRATGPDVNFVITTHLVPTDATSQATNSDATFIDKVPVPNTAGIDRGRSGVISLGASMGCIASGTSVIAATPFPAWDAGTPVTINGTVFFLASDATPSAITLTSAPGDGSCLLTTPMSTIDVDFGFFDWVDIGDYVWNDANHNGVQDAGEAPIPGVTVHICEVVGSSCVQARQRLRNFPFTLNALVVDQTTDVTGHYIFVGLYPGKYKLTFTPPAGPGWVATIQGSMPGPNLTTVTDNPMDTVLGAPINGPVTVTPVGKTSNDSVIDATGMTGTVTGKSGQNSVQNNAILYVDAGYYVPTPPSTFGHGDTATIGFWNNKNGQALIKSVNGGSTATKLGNWLATNYPFLFGPSSANNCAGLTNAQVAALFQKLFKVSGDKVDAQIMANALAVYVTNSTLAGGNYAAGYGFNVSTTGTGAKTYNVGSLGTALGLTNNTSYTISQLLAQANLDKQNNTYNANAWGVIADLINQGGDII